MAGLLEEGMAPDMPAAVLERGTTSAQRKIVGTVGDIAKKAVREQVQSPAIILVGHVAAFQDMDWYGNRPLAGKKILVTRPGSAVCALPPCSVRRGRRCWSFPRSALRRWRTGKACPGAGRDWNLFLDRLYQPLRCADLSEELRKRRQDVRGLTHLKIAVIGEGTAGELENWGLYPDLVPEQYDGDHLGEALAGCVKVGEKILIPRARIGNQTLVRRLEEAGAR